MLTYPKSEAIETIPALTTESGDAHQRLEIALVRELEIAYSSGAPIAVVAHAAPYQWANACHDLFEAGRIDILEFAVRRLHPIYPDLTYLSTMLAMYDAMPRHLPPPLPFCEDPAAEIQILQRPDCDKVLLCFCACRGTMGLPVNFVHQWLGRVPASLVYIKDLRNLAGGCGFPTLGPGRASATAAFLRIADEIGGKEIYTFGVSLGGYAALYYGLQLGAVSALSLGSATDYTPDFINSQGPVKQETRDLWEFASDYAVSLRDCYEQALKKPRVMIAYGAANPRDRGQAKRMAGMPNVELLPMDYAQHNVIEPLIRNHELMPLLERHLSAGSAS